MAVALRICNHCHVHGFIEVGKLRTRDFQDKSEARVFTRTLGEQGDISPRQEKSLLKLIENHLDDRNRLVSGLDYILGDRLFTSPLVNVACVTVTYETRHNMEVRALLPPHK